MKYYKNREEFEIKVGIISIIAFLILFIGYGWLRDLINVKDYSRIKVLFYDVNGLEPGDPVSVYGLVMGKVEKLEITEKGVIAYLKVVLEFPLKEQTKLVIEETDMMGHKQVSIFPGEGEKKINLEEVMIGVAADGISDLVEKISGIASEVEILIDSINSRDVIGKTDLLMDSLTVFIGNAEDLVEDTNENLSKTIKQFSELTTELKLLVKENKGQVNTTIINLNKVLENLDREINQFAKTNKNMAIISDKVLDNNSISKLLTEKELYDKLVLSVENLNSLIEDIKKNPKKYFTIEIF